MNDTTLSPPASDDAAPHVLLVEDYAANVLVAGLYLEQFGCTFDVAENGGQAIEKLAANRYDVVLMDVQMPGMDGISATLLLREQETASGRNRVPVIGMTAHVLSGDRERCLAAGMDDYVSKPFDPDVLKAKIDHYAGRAAG